MALVGPKVGQESGTTHIKRTISVLYLAEVQKQKSGLMGFKTDLKLLACQRTDQSWSAVTADEVIPAPDEANNFNAGVLVLVELSGNKQVQRPPTEAGRQLVSILQNFSRQLEKSKTQEEEIEQWKQSLTYQSQELNRREMEMEARVEQLAQLDEDFERLEAQRQEIDTAREETQRLREEFERNRLELEGAWEHLRGETRRLEERQAEYQQGTVLDEAQGQKIRELLDRLAGAIAPTEAIREQLNLAFEIVNGQQELLNGHWQQLEQQRNSATQMQGDVDRQTQELQRRTEELTQAENALEKARSERMVFQNALEMKQEFARMQDLQLRTQQELYEQLNRLATTSADVKISQKIDLEALEKMPLGELQEVVQNLQQDLEKVVRFVNDQEEELTFQRQTVDELQAKINQASEYDRMSLENELAEEQDCYQMLDETLVGQRRNLREREEILNQHQRVLRRRQGVMESDGQDNQKIDLGPVLSQLDGQRQQQSEELQKLESQVEQMRLSISQAQGMIDHQAGEQEATRNQIKQLEQNLLSSRTALAELWARVNVYQEMLQPYQDRVNEMRQKLEAIASTLAQVQETGDYQLQSIAQMREVIVSLMSGQFNAA
ncbi:pilus motility taxis protein HmpF [Funiculus sociatus]|uniref:pilus motility taxis protein HmpF n=1 Tax=Funiculus sociatus TaxID=450527 RepID=UPI0032980375